jgi:hypothetical protein
MGPGVRLRGDTAAGKEAMNDKDKEAAFLLALDNIRTAIKDLPGWDACLVLTICLAECIVYGNSKNDAPDQALRLAQTVTALGDIITDMMAEDGGDDSDIGDDNTPRPSAQTPDLLRKFLEHRRATKKK